SQPSLTNAIRRLEQELGGALFKRKPAVALTVLGHAVHSYLQRIAEDADSARDTAHALVTAADHRAASVSETASVDPYQRPYYPRTKTLISGHPLNSSSGPSASLFDV